jgi:hypothetical protein
LSARQMQCQYIDSAIKGSILYCVAIRGLNLIHGKHSFTRGKVFQKYSKLDIITTVEPIMDNCNVL